MRLCLLALRNKRLQMRKIENGVYQVFLLFSFLGVLFIPFSFRYLSIQSEITKFFFQDLIVWIASHVDCIHIANPAIASDSTTLYLLVLVLFLVAVLGMLVLSYVRVWKKHQAFIIQTIQLLLVGYLSLVMLKYGFDKLFKAQFYLPEPNTLYTPLGNLDKDILYWSTMGVSYTYNVFIGFAELLPAILLLFRRTRILALCILLGVLLHVVCVNLGFDISVKLYSMFLLFVCTVLLVPSIRSLIQFFLYHQPTTLSPITGATVIPSNTQRSILKAILILFLFIESLFPYILSGQYNDDHIPRNYLHGAYQVLPSDKLSENGGGERTNIKRLFIHRHNYFIFQYADDSMEDFSLEIQPSQNQFILTNYEGEKITAHYMFSDKTKILELDFDTLNLTIQSKALPWEELPLLQPLFHWTVDGIDASAK